MSDDLQSTENVENIENVESVEASPAATNQWYSEEYADVIESKGFQSADDVLKSYKNLEQHQGNMFKQPDADAGQEAWDEFYSKLGRPADPGDYGLDEYITSKYEGIQIEAINDELTEFEQTAHSLGLTPAQTKGLTDMRLQAITEQNQVIQQSFEENQKAIQKMWGNEYENKLNNAKSAVAALRQQDEQSTNLLLQQSQDNPMLANILAQLGEAYKEGQVELGNSAPLSRDEAAQQIEELHKDKEFMRICADPMHPKHSEYNSRRERLYRVKHGGR